jgi:hypothetical protein
MELAISNDNIQNYYMQIALLKKYFKLARNLLKYKVCKNYLNSSIPESEDWMFVMHKHQLNLKKKQYEKNEFATFQDNAENKDKFMELLAIDESKNETLKEELEEKEDSLSEEEIKSNKFGTNIVKQSTLNKFTSLKELKKLPTMKLGRDISRNQTTSFDKIKNLDSIKDNKIVDELKQNLKKDTPEIDATKMNEMGEKGFSEKVKQTNTDLSHTSNEIINFFKKNKKPIDDTTTPKPHVIPGINNQDPLTISKVVSLTKNNHRSVSMGIEMVEKMGSIKLREGEKVSQIVRKETLPEEITVNDVKKNKYKINVQLVLIEQLR